MEQSQHGLLEELMAPRRDNLTTSPTGLVNDFFTNSWSFESFDENPVFDTSNPPFLGLTSLADQPSFQSPFNPFLDPPYDKNCSIPFIHPIQEDFPSIVDGGELLGNDLQGVEEREDMNQVLNMGLGGERKGRGKKAEGQPSKNLMAERRRRKRLNDRLSMLRSIVPKISKMDRTSILGDTIDYMKELLEKIKKLQEEDVIASSIDQLTLMSNFKELKPDELLVKNSPKFDVERRNTDTRIEMCCANKPGLLLSTAHTLEVLGLDIQQCVISCFNDFAIQASCSEAVEQRTTMRSEDIKQELFRNAGYGGRCL